jgi:hypothetical protein
MRRAVDLEHAIGVIHGTAKARAPGAHVYRRRGSGEDRVYIHVDTVVGDEVAAQSKNIATGQADGTRIKAGVMNRHPCNHYVGVISDVPNIVDLMPNGFQPRCDLASLCLDGGLASNRVSVAEEEQDVIRQEAKHSIDVPAVAGGEHGPDHAGSRWSVGH